MQICLNAPPLFCAPYLTNTRLIRRRRSSLFRPGCRAVRLGDLSMMLFIFWLKPFHDSCSILLIF
jgi:hypothetical protein